jgi:uncharacterized phage protein gp47/JayE
MATAEEYRKSMLADVSDDYDKAEGSFIYDSITPVANELVKVDLSIENLKSKLSIENLSGDELAQRVSERTGIERKPSQKAKGTVTVLGNGTVTINDKFETTAGQQFQATETKTITSSGDVNIEAVITGTIGNVPANQVTLIPVTIAGITSVNNSQPVSNGFNAESDVDLLKRYYDQIRTPATSANKSQYRNWVNSFTGVGDSRVIPLWAGDLTIKILIINANKQPADSTLVSQVQAYIDPTSNGLGEGIAPLGYYVTIESAVGINIDVSFTLTRDTAYTLEQATANVNTAITEYLKSIAFVTSQVSYAKISNVIFDSQGVLDISGLTINGGVSNIVIASDKVAILGTLTIT